MIGSMGETRFHSILIFINIVFFVICLICVQRSSITLLYFVEKELGLIELFLDFLTKISQVLRNMRNNVRRVILLFAVNGGSK